MRRQTAVVSKAAVSLPRSAASTLEPELIHQPLCAVTSACVCLSGRLDRQTRQRFGGSSENKSWVCTEVTHLRKGRKVGLHFRATKIGFELNSLHITVKLLRKQATPKRSTKIDRTLCVAIWFRAKSQFLGSIFTTATKSSFTFDTLGYFFRRFVGQGRVAGINMDARIAFVFRMINYEDRKTNTKVQFVACALSWMSARHCRSFAVAE